jgi:inorganic pyrophosphatase
LITGSSAAMRFPVDSGFIPGTLAENRGPLGALILVEEPTFPGCRVGTRPIGALRLADGATKSHTIVTVPCGDPQWSPVSDVTELAGALRAEIRHFFEISRDLEPSRTVPVGDFVKRAEALVVSEEGAARFHRSAGTSGLPAAIPLTP